MKTPLNENIPFLRSMVTCLSKVVNDGYSEDFKATSGGLRSVSTDKLYTPDQVRVVNFSVRRILRSRRQCSIVRN